MYTYRDRGGKRRGRWRPRWQAAGSVRCVPDGWRLASGGVLKIRIFGFAVCHGPRGAGSDGIGRRDQTAEIVYTIEWTAEIAE
jgi:hypothetical protein